MKREMKKKKMEKRYKRKRIMQEDDRVESNGK